MKNQNNQPRIGIPEGVCGVCGFSGQDMLDLHGAEGALVITKNRMTALELATVIDAIGSIASELTVALATACGRCDNCGGENSKTCSDCNGGAVRTRQGGCMDTPADWVPDCSLCRGLMNGGRNIQIPGDILDAAGIPEGAKLEAFSNDEGEIVVTEAEFRHNISDIPSGVISVLATSGVCLGSLDELVMQEEIVYGE